MDAGPYEGLAKEDLPAQLCAFTHGVMQAWAGHRPGYYDLVHSHYWLSGHVGWLAAERWGAPLVHAMHTMAKVKNAALADGDTPEPAARVIGETQIVRAADRLIANTSEEADELVRHYEAEADKVAVVHPGVNLDRFRPADGRAAARDRLGLPQDALIPLFAGRIQPLKAPDVLLRAVAVLLEERPDLRSHIVVPVVGGPSGSGLAKPEGLQKLAARLGIADVVRFRPPVGQEQLADWFRAASVLVMPSYSESFGLVAIEAQAAGTPVLAAAVGGLPVAVRRQGDGFPGALATIPPTTRACCAISPTTGRSRTGWARRPPGTPSPSAGTRRPAPRRTSTRPRCTSTGVAYAPTMADVQRAVQVIEEFLKDAELEWESPGPGNLRGEAPRHPQAVDDRVADRRQALPVAERLRDPPPRRERVRASTAGSWSATSSSTA